MESHFRPSASIMDHVGGTLDLPKIAYLSRPESDGELIATRVPLYKGTTGVKQIVQSGQRDSYDLRQE